MSLTGSVFVAGFLALFGLGLWITTETLKGVWRMNQRQSGQRPIAPEDFDDIHW